MVCQRQIRDMSLLGSASALRRIGQSAHLDFMQERLPGRRLVRRASPGHSPGIDIEEECVAKRGLPVVLLALALLAAGCGGGEGAATPRP